VQLFVLQLRLAMFFQRSCRFLK